MSHWKQRPIPPFCSHLGIQIVEWEPDQVVLSASLEPAYCNTSESPHGGFLSTLIDVATALAGVYCPTPGHMRKALTLSLSVSFVGRAQGNSLRTVGRVTAAGSKIFHSSADVYDEQGNLVASGQAVCRYRSGSETLEGEPF